MSVGLGFCKILAVSLITITLTIITLQIPRYTGLENLGDSKIFYFFYVVIFLILKYFL